jgi:hypothetical protein
MQPPTLVGRARDGKAGSTVWVMSLDDYEVGPPVDSLSTWQRPRGSRAGGDSGNHSSRGRVRGCARCGWHGGGDAVAFRNARQTPIETPDRR